LGAVLISILIIFSIIRKYKKDIFPVSFQEGNENNTLEIISDTKLDNIENDKSVIFLQKNNEKYLYRLSSENKDYLLQIVKNLEISDVNFEYSINLS